MVSYFYNYYHALDDKHAAWTFNMHNNIYKIRLTYKTSKLCMYEFVPKMIQDNHEMNIQHEPTATAVGVRPI